MSPGQGEFFTRLYYIPQGGNENQEKSSCRDNLPVRTEPEAGAPKKTCLGLTKPLWKQSLRYDAGETSAKSHFVVLSAAKDLGFSRNL
jgi:hypothetical protein